jgi:hypothetical protein
MSQPATARSACRRRTFVAGLPLFAAFLGCRLFSTDNEYSMEESGEFSASAQLPNPLLIPAGDREFIWNQIVDELDNYFTIQREQRIQSVSNVLTEGTIQMRPRVGATYLEPWRPDSTTSYERTLATFQSIRRTARARVIPVENGTLLDLTVLKELEHLERPAQASAGAMIARHDSSLVREEVPPGTFTVTPGWIALGRDVALEQRILRNLYGRLCNPATPHKVPAEGIFADR